MCSTLRSSVRETASLCESGDHTTFGRGRGFGLRSSCVGCGVPVPYAKNSTPSVVSCTESPPPFERSHRLWSLENTSHAESGDSTYGEASYVVSPTMQLYCRMSQSNRFFPTRNSIAVSLRRKSKLLNGSLAGLYAVSFA